MLTICKVLVHQCIQYACHSCEGGEVHSYNFWTEYRITGISSLRFPSSYCFQSFKYHRITDCFFILIVLHANWSSEFIYSKYSILKLPRCARLSTQVHSNYVQTPSSRGWRYLDSFAPYSDKLWNSLLLFVFHPRYDSFKSFSNCPCEGCVKTPLKLSRSYWYLILYVFHFPGPASRNLFLLLLFLALDLSPLIKEK